MQFTQLTRLAQVSSPLGPDVLILKNMSGGDELGRLFEYELQLTSKDDSIDLNQLLGKPVSLSLQLGGGSSRYFHGVVSRCSQNVDTGQFARYQVTLRPWLWLLTRTTDCKIFQHLTIPQIIKQVFRDLGFSDFEDALSRPYREWEYCVQYRESSFDFVSRLMEQEGIYYFFRHEKDRHVLVMADAYGAHHPAPGYDSVPFYPPDGQHRERDHISDWRLAQAVQPGSVELNDYDFQRPGARIDVRSAIRRPHTAGDYPLYDYPGTYVQSKDGEHYALTRIEAIQSQHERVELSGNARGLGSGHLFSMSGFSRQDQNREYLIVSTRYLIAQESLETGSASAGLQFESALGCIAAQQSFRPLPITPRPIVKGPQTAIVVGPSGEEIWTDQFGRVKVHFYWDRHDQSNENSSCWIRVSQAWAGKNWGSMQIPRIGQEVIVSFLEGDPDRPIITGRVYNAEQTVPYDLPANATQSGMKSRSSKGGTPANFNEIRMEDKKGAEQLYIHAERNQDIVVEVDESHSVGNDRNKSVGHNETVTIGLDRLRAVLRNDTLHVGGAKSDSVSTGYLIEAGSQIRLVCGKSVLELNASGEINISGSSFKLYASGKGDIDTGGRLDLNSGGAGEVDAKGKGIKSVIDAAVKAFFTGKPNA
ncbi:type VI secretion system tip protein TssI/VgrG [Pseudomonas abietaniphila]|uniref:Type VI secretion system secreted protein VgrG n=1 Tax=Pseudomonas abietaniphila TaxID=89065 RepID=A0A1G7ZQM7_9PSED|nr:type VI secretion system tip protein TssI/VgrG [Pseudomonas abietaniphila]SDH10945.1 type VI secretion system secreted protein VgrG [Pseudomonas abietaniphila]